LKKRKAFRQAFDHFDMYKVAAYDASKIDELMQNAGIIRNRLKIEATVNNANRFLEIVNEYGSFDVYIWNFVDNKPIINHWKSLSEIPSRTELSDKISNDLKRRGFKFVGSTIVYSHMQATGMVNDHLVNCFCHPETD
jgi:DNA-3-methyladenine glycosylase I